MNNLYCLLEGKYHIHEMERMLNTSFCPNVHHFFEVLIVRCVYHNCSCWVQGCTTITSSITIMGFKGKFMLTNTHLSYAIPGQAGKGGGFSGLVNCDFFQDYEITQ